jgi:ABC-type proline/glycine betaine transport system ATPase subunit
MSGVLLEVRNLTRIFGRDPARVRAMLAEGLGKGRPS